MTDDASAQVGVEAFPGDEDRARGLTVQRIDADLECGGGTVTVLGQRGDDRQEVRRGAAEQFFPGMSPQHVQQSASFVAGAGADRVEDVAGTAAGDGHGQHVRGVDHRGEEPDEVVALSYAVRVDVQDGDLVEGRVAMHDRCLPRRRHEHVHACGEVDGTGTHRCIGDTRRGRVIGVASPRAGVEEGERLAFHPAQQRGGLAELGGAGVGAEEGFAGCCGRRCVVGGFDVFRGVEAHLAHGGPCVDGGDDVGDDTPELGDDLGSPCRADPIDFHVYEGLGAVPADVDHRVQAERRLESEAVEGGEDRVDQEGSVVDDHVDAGVWAVPAVGVGGGLVHGETERARLSFVPEAPPPVQYTQRVVDADVEVGPVAGDLVEPGGRDRRVR